MNTSIDLQTLFWICSGIAGLYAVYKIIRAPFAQVADHERRITSIETNLAAQKATDKLILKSLNAITNHMIDGNSVDKLKEARDELQQGIIDSK